MGRSSVRELMRRNVDSLLGRGVRDSHMVEYRNMLLIDKRAFTMKRVVMSEAVAEIGVDAEHIEWCLEEYNRCDVDNFILINEEYDGDHPV